MLLLEQHAQIVGEKLTSLHDSKYKSLLLSGPPLMGKTVLAREVSELLGACYIDVTSDLLPAVSRPVLGAFGANDFFGWVREEAQTKGRTCVFDEIEPLIATFGQKGAVDFFRLAQRLDRTPPVLIVTRLMGPLEKSGFPTDRIYRLAG